MIESATRHACVEGQNIFVPISLGNHYYSVPVLRRLVNDYIRPSNLSIILICDRLRFLSYLIRGEIDTELSEEISKGHLEK
jgi:hypothetical protein